VSPDEEDANRRSADVPKDDLLKLFLKSLLVTPPLNNIAPRLGLMT
jgi:hypothetical protein